MAALLVLALAAAVVVVWVLNSRGDEGDSPDPGKVPTGAPANMRDFLLSKEESASAGFASFDKQNHTLAGLGVPDCLSKERVPAGRPQFNDGVELTGGVGRLTHRFDQYSDVESAKQAFEVLTRDLGSCVGTTENETFITDAGTVTGMGDQVVMLQVQVSRSANPFLQYLLVQSGKAVNIVELKSPKAVSLESLSKVVDPIVSQQCATVQGSCNASPRYTQTPPTPGLEQGFLVPPDLPQVKNDGGTWFGDKPTPNVKTKLSGCEGQVLAKVKPVKQFQRVMLMHNSDESPLTFGLDTVVMAFKSDKEASAFASSLNKSLASCGSKKPGATVDKAKSVQATSTTPVKATYYPVKMRSTKGVVSYRLAVIVSGTHVVYAVMTPGPNYDLTIPAYEKVLIRAGERAAQMA